jgi:predicted acyl esterase
MADLSDSPAMGTRITGLIVVAALVAASCSGDDGGTNDTTTTVQVTTTAQPTTEAPTTEAPTTEPPSTDPVGLPTDVETAEFTVRPGVEQVAILDAEPGDSVTVLTADGTEVATGEVDVQGAFLARSIEPGDYAVLTDGESRRLSDVVTVLSPDDIPDQAFYGEQRLATEGMSYIEVRDGTTLSASVWLPGPADAGPYPTVVEYSGYSPSDPASSTFAQLFNAMGYAYVGVNMRGSGCSGGSFRYFELSQHTDGYDVIETVAAQPWVKFNQVGMVGISYSGISQLYVAKMQPPSLAAITPLSVIENAYRSVLYPGGLLNTGFALNWTQERMDETRPYGQEWTTIRAEEGDQECADNQALRLQNDDLVAEIRENPFYRFDYEPELSPVNWVDQIEVPTFLAGAWQDEQTGGRWPNLIDEFTTEHLSVSLVNGLHTESLSLGVFERMSEFLSLYVKRETPSFGGARIVAPILAGSIFGVEGAELPADRFEGMSYEDALAEFESEAPIRVLFEQGADEDWVPGAPSPRFVGEFDAWPIPTTQARAWYLGPDGVLTADEPAADGGSSDYVADPSALPPAFFIGGSSAIWRADVQYDWQPIPEGKGLVFTSDAFDEDTVMVGTGSADLWISSDAEDTDLEVAIIEVRPDGTEYYVQAGFLRASHRLLDDDQSTELSPVHTHLADDAEPLTPGELTPVRVEIFPFAHPFRAGSKLRITIDAPGNNRPVWELESISDGETVTVAHDAEHPSRIVLGVVPGVEVPAGLPPCPGLRGQPCRPGS